MEWDFSPADPNAKMRMVTKIERIQPTCIGINPKGEFIWEGRAMPIWQMEMLKVAVNMFSEFFTHWIEVYKFEKEDIEVTPHGDLELLPTATKARLSEMRRMYPKKARSTK